MTSAVALSQTGTTHSLVQLARNQCFHVPDASYLDFRERATVNQLAGSRRQ